MVWLLTPVATHAKIVAEAVAISEVTNANAPNHASRKWAVAALLRLPSDLTGS